jgi:hypothetical protein
MANPVKDQPFRIISQAEFTTYTRDWQSFLIDSPDKLSNCFFVGGTMVNGKLTGGQFINYQYLNAGDVMTLLSSVATAVIRVRFGAVSSPNDDKRVFGLILYGEDAEGKRTSGYFLAAIPGLTGVLEPTYSAAKRAAKKPVKPNSLAVTSDSKLPFEPLPYDLAVRWTNNWQPFGQDATKITNELFQTVYSPEMSYLEGYAYPLEDFLLALRPLQDTNEQRLLFVFGVHQYYKPTDLTITSNLLDMILTIEPAPPASEPQYIMMATNQPYFDVSMPSPPFHSI